MAPCVAARRAFSSASFLRNCCGCLLLSPLLFMLSYSSSHGQYNGLPRYAFFRRFFEFSMSEVSRRSVSAVGSVRRPSTTTAMGVVVYPELK